MFDSFVNFITQGLIKLILKLPASPFLSSDVDFGSWETILSYVNYFFPFYRLAPMIELWIGVTSVSLSVFLLIKFTLKKVVG